MNTQTSPTLWLSLGENCLSDDVLKRYGRKSFSTPYSSARTNIDYALALERMNYEGLLDPENLVLGDAWGTPVVRSSLVDVVDPIFEASCSKGFEFTHHNPLSSAKDKASLERKVARLLAIRRVQNVVFLYHHRHTSRSNLEKLKSKLKEFSAIYSDGSVRCTIGFFRQQIISRGEDRHLEKIVIDDSLIEFVFHTEIVWGGKVPDILWARCDDDLIGNMIAELETFSDRR